MGLPRDSQQIPIRKYNYDFQTESQFYVDVLTKELCELNEEGTFTIVSDGADDLSSDNSDDDLENLEADDTSLAAADDDGIISNQIESSVPMQVITKDSQFNQTQGKQ